MNHSNMKSAFGRARQGYEGTVRSSRVERAFAYRRALKGTAAKKQFHSTISLHSWIQQMLLSKATYNRGTKEIHHRPKNIHRNFMEKVENDFERTKKN